MRSRYGSAPPLLSFRRLRTERVRPVTAQLTHALARRRSVQSLRRRSLCRVELLRIFRFCRRPEPSDSPLRAHQQITPRAPSALSSAANASLISLREYVRLTSSRSFSLPS